MPRPRICRELPGFRTRPSTNETVMSFDVFRALKPKSIEDVLAEKARENTPQKRIKT